MALTNEVYFWMYIDSLKCDENHWELTIPLDRLNTALNFSIPWVLFDLLSLLLLRLHSIVLKLELKPTINHLRCYSFLLIESASAPGHGWGCSYSGFEVRLRGLENQKTERAIWLIFSKASDKMVLKNSIHYVPIDGPYNFHDSHLRQSCVYHWLPRPERWIYLLGKLTCPSLHRK